MSVVGTPCTSMARSMTDLAVVEGVTGTGVAPDHVRPLRLELIVGQNRGNQAQPHSPAELSGAC